MNRQQYLAKNTALFALNSIGTRLITFFLVPLYTKAFSTTEYGIIDLISTISTILVPIITLNIGEAIMRFSLDEDADKNSIMNVGVFFVALSFVSGLSVIVVLDYFTDITISRGVIYIYCILQGIYQTFSCNLRGQEKLLNYAIANILNTFVTAFLNIFFLLVLKWGINGYFYAYILALLVSSIYCYVVGNVGQAIKRFTINKSLMKNMVKYSIVLVPNSLMWWIMNSSDHVMVTAMIGATANGIYAISYKLPSILSALSTVFNQAWSYSAIHENKSSDREEFNNSMYDKIIRFQLLITVMLMFIMKPFLKIYVAAEYYGAWKYTPYLLVGNFFLTLATFLSTFYTVNKDSHGFLFSGTVGAVINITLNGLLIPRYGVSGAAFATCISYIIVFLYRVKDTRKYMMMNVFKRDYIFNYILLITSACMMLLDTRLVSILLLILVFVACLVNRTIIFDCIGVVYNRLKR